MKSFLFIIASLWTATALLAAPPSREPDGILLDSYAAIVNGKVITVGEVLDAMRPLQESLALKAQGAELQRQISDAYIQTRDELIESELILQDFNQQGGTLPARAMEDHINSVIHERFADDRTELLKALAAERLTYDEWRTQMQNQLIAQLMRQREVVAKILITPFDIQAAYDANRRAYTLPESVHLRLFIPPPNSAIDLDTLARRLRQGALSAEDALQHFGITVQDDGFVETTSLNKTIRAAIRNLTPGEVSDPVRFNDTAYLVHLLDIRKSRLQPLDEVSAQIEQALRHAEFERLNKIWINSLRAKYYVQVFAHDLFR